MKLKDLKKGDIVTYRNGKTNNVNNLGEYQRCYRSDLSNRKYRSFDIMKVQRYIKLLWFYRLKTIYKRKEK